jgi:two-component system chemotaxis sensor kinase CheA
MTTPDNAEKEFLERLRATFRIEAEEHLQEISSALLQMEQSAESAADQQLIESIYRHAHSLKGAARAVNILQVESVCQSLESVFGAWKRKPYMPTHEQFDLIHSALDAMQQSVPDVAGKVSPISDSDVQILKSKLKSLSPAEFEVRALDNPIIQSLTGLTQPVQAGPQQPVSHIKEQPQPLPASPAVPVASNIALGMPEKATNTVRIATEKLDKLLLEAEAMLAMKLISAEWLGQLRQIENLGKQWKRAWGRVQPAIKQLRSSTGPAETAAGTNGGFKSGAVTGRAGRQTAAEIMEFLEWNLGFFKDLDARIEEMVRNAVRDTGISDKLVDDLLADSKNLLMLPFSTVSSLFPKLVRDLAREQNKDVELTLTGELIEMDKRILEEMKSPLIHLIRNCVDHGVETPEIRVQHNKPPRASVRISASNPDSKSVEISVSDDGRGIDLAALRQSAVRAKLITAEEAANLTDDKVLDLAFRSGVSTSPSVTAISGLGLGLAIVREKAEQLGGSVAVRSRTNLGTTFTVTLPLSLATMEVVFVRAADQLFAIPMGSVQHVARIASSEVHVVQNCETIQFHNTVVPIVHLAEILQLRRNIMRSEAENYIDVIIVESGRQVVGFIVEEVQHDEQILVKNFSKPLSRVRNFSGAAVLPSGQVVPILNVLDLQKAARSRTGFRPVSSAATPEESAHHEAAPTRILLAEDSITARMLLKGILESAGFIVQTAVDGMDALTALRTEDFDLVVSDVEMPRMNGFELTAAIRANPKLSAIPVILVTALASQSDRERGIDAGANAYIVKSTFEQQNLLDVIHRYV